MRKKEQLPLSHELSGLESTSNKKSKHSFVVQTISQLKINPNLVQKKAKVAKTRI
jgi:hypothetical protein